MGVELGASLDDFARRCQHRKTSRSIRYEISVDERRKRIEDPQRLVALRNQLDRAIKNVPESILPLYVEPSIISGSIKILGRGVLSDVFLVETTHGPLALKVVYFHEHLMSKPSKSGVAFPHGILLQELLGEIGDAPRLVGVIPRERLPQLFDRIPFEKRNPNMATHAVLMEVVDKTREFKPVPFRSSYKETRPPRVSRTAQANLKRLANRLSILRILPTDSSVLEQEDGSIVILDLDLSYYYDAQLRPYGWSGNYRDGPKRLIGPYQSFPGLEFHPWFKVEN